MYGAETAAQRKNGLRKHESAAGPDTYRAPRAWQSRSVTELAERRKEERPANGPKRLFGGPRSAGMGTMDFSCFSVSGCAS